MEPCGGSRWQQVANRMARAAACRAARVPMPRSPPRSPRRRREATASCPRHGRAPRAPRPPRLVEEQAQRLGHREMLPGSTSHLRGSSYERNSCNLRRVKTAGASSSSRGNTEGTPARPPLSTRVRALSQNFSVAMPRTRPRFPPQALTPLRVEQTTRACSFHSGRVSATSAPPAGAFDAVAVPP